LTSNECAKVRALAAYELRKAGLTYREIAIWLGGISSERARQIAMSGMRRSQFTSWQSKLGLSARVSNCIANAGIKSKSELVAKIKSGAFHWKRPGVRNLGPKTYAELMQLLQLKPNLDD
jgi:DNA-directed RNA polymerase alpha subunit